MCLMTRIGTCQVLYVFSFLLCVYSPVMLLDDMREDVLHTLRFSFETKYINLPALPTSDQIAYYKVPCTLPRLA